jgi:hypothetical protein
MVDKPLGDDPCHHLGRVVFALAAIEPERESQGLG